MMTIEQIRAALSDRNIKSVCRATGLSYPTVLGIKSGKSDNPQYHTVAKLAEYLSK